jgi:DHA1 family bicyclomycin/chloramphenicol resistance-like MFS transporter
MNRRKTSTLGVISTLGPFQFDAYLPALPAMAIYFATSDTNMQLTVTASLLGMSVGQLLMGPISDSLGRRRPLLAALVVFTIASLACLWSSNVVWLIISRFVLGLASASGYVIANAYIRDVASGPEAARLFATLASIFSVAPIVAPIIGGQLLNIGDWHVIFIFLAVVGLIVLSLAAVNLPESRPREKRTAFNFSSMLRSWGTAFSDSRFRVLAFTGGLVFGATAVFLAGSPFALQVGFGLTPTQSTFFFALAMVALLTANLVNRALLKRFSSLTMFRFGLVQAMVAALVLLVSPIFQIVSLPLSVIGFGIGLSVMGFTQPNIMNLALQDHAERAGSAAGIVGFFNAFFGAIIAPLTGVFFSVDLFGVSSFIAIVLIAAALVGLIGLRKEKPQSL